MITFEGSPPDPMDDHDRRAHLPVHPVLARLGAYAWRLIVIAVVVVGALWLLRQVRVVFFPVVIAIFVARVLSPVAGWLRRHRWPAGLAAATAMGSLLVVVAGALAFAIPSFTGELDSIGPTVTAAVDDIEDWLVDDSPFDVSRATIDEVRQRAREQLTSLTESSDSAIGDRAALAAEVVTGLVLAVILTFFMIRDGERGSTWICERFPAERRAGVRRGLDAAWSTLAGYLRGATLLGVVESVLIGLTLLIAGGGLVAPVMLITFLCAFVPVVGAIVAGVVAVLVALVTGGVGAAIAVAVVALVVQQFDNDLLAPVIYGRALSLHPVVILLSVVGGGALFGLAGTVLAVPTVAVTVNAVKQYRAVPDP